MTDVFLSFLAISVPISFLIALLLMLTPFLNRRYAAKWKYWIWIVLALRLIIPLGGNAEGAVADTQSQARTHTAPESENTPSDIPTVGAVRGRVVVEIPTQMTAPIVMQPEKTDSNISMLDILAFVWMLGSLLFIAVHLASYFYYKHQLLKRGKAVKDKDVLRLLRKLKRELHIKCKVSVREYSGAASPMLMGFFHHVLILPEEQYDPQELFFILKHELIHMKRGDIYFKLLFAAANGIHWFNPLIWLMQKEASVDMELSCDERVTQGMGYAARKAYTETLFSTLRKQNAKKVFLSTGFYGGKEIMKKRFKNILTKKGKKNGAAGGGHWLKQSQEKLAKLQRKLGRMQPGSKNYQDAVQKYRELHEHIANQRRDFIHKESRRIANAWDAVCMRNDSVQEVSKKEMLPGNALDSGFGMFRECLRYKLERQGKPLILLDRYTPTSRICSVCGQVHSCDLHRRTVWICPKCGTKHNREINAAKSIKALGLDQYFSSQELRKSA